jgi:hypothetical protein
MTPRRPQEAEDANPHDRATPDPFLRMDTSKSHSRETSQTRSGGSNDSSGSSVAPVLRRAHSARPVLNTTQLSPTSRHQRLLPAATLPIATNGASLPSSGARSGAPSLHSAPPVLPTSAQTFQGRLPPTPLLHAARSGTWFAGPTRAAKEGIVREWTSLDGSPHSPRDPSAGDDGEGGDARELGRRLLYAQLAAMTPLWVVADLEEEEAATEMLVERWVRPGAVRRRMAQWEELMAAPEVAREEEPRRAIGDEEVVMRFHFGR